MEDRETARMRKYGERKTTRIMMASVPHVTSGLGLRKFQADGFLLTRVYKVHYYILVFVNGEQVNLTQREVGIYIKNHRLSPQKIIYLT